jgi:hypothetical protein
MNFRRNFIKFPFAVALAGSLALTALPSFAQSVTLLNVSIRPHPGVVCGVQPGLCQILGRADHFADKASFDQIYSRKKAAAP